MGLGFILAMQLAFASEIPNSPTKPEIESLLKPKSIHRILEENDIVTDSNWENEVDFSFVDSTLIRVPLHFSRPLITDPSIYREQLSAAAEIEKFEFDPQTQIMEIAGKAKGLRMHSWIKVDYRYFDELHYEIVQGDMKGFKVNAYLWDKKGKTLIAAKGIWPGGKKRFSAPIAFLFKEVSEIVIGVATKSFRGYIEKKHKESR